MLTFPPWARSVRLVMQAFTVPCFSSLLFLVEMLPYLSSPMYSVIFFFLSYQGWGRIPAIKKMNRKVWTHTLGGWESAQELAGEAQHRTAGASRSSSRGARASLACHRDSRVDQGKLCGPGKNGAIRVRLKRGLIRKQSGSARSWPPHEGVAGGSQEKHWVWIIRAAVVQRGMALQTRTELLSAHSPCAAMRAASPRVSGGFKEKGRFCSLHLSLVTTVFKEPPPRGWFGSELVSSLAVSAFWSGKLACLLTPTAGTFSL